MKYLILAILVTFSTTSHADAESKGVKTDNQLPKILNTSKCKLRAAFTKTAGAMKNSEGHCKTIKPHLIIRVI